MYILHYTAQPAIWYSCVHDSDNEYSVIFIQYFDAPGWLADVQICRVCCILTAIKSLVVTDDWMYSGKWSTRKLLSNFAHIPLMFLEANGRGLNP